MLRLLASLSVACCAEAGRIADYLGKSDEGMNLEEQLGSIVATVQGGLQAIPHGKTVQLECANSNSVLMAAGSHFFNHVNKETTNGAKKYQFRVVQCGECAHNQFALQSIETSNFLMVARNTHAVVQSPFSEIDDEILTVIDGREDGSFGLWTKAGSFLSCGAKGGIEQSGTTQILQRHLTPTASALKANEKFRFVLLSASGNVVTQQTTISPTPRPTPYCPCPSESPCRQMHDGQCRPKTNVDGQPDCSKFGSASWTLDRAIQEWKYSSSNPFRQGHASSGRCYCATGTLDLFLHVCMKLPVNMVQIGTGGIKIDHHRIPTTESPTLTPTIKVTPPPTSAPSVAKPVADACAKCNSGACASCHFCRNTKAGHCAFCWKKNPAGHACLQSDGPGFEGCEPCWKTKSPTQPPTSAPPTKMPTVGSTDAPTNGPTSIPSRAPTMTPTRNPTNTPTKAPTHAPVDCSVSPWGGWTECNAKCNGGVQKRTRAVVTRSAHDGKLCPELSELQNCNTKPCSTDCKFEWQQWTECSSTCGGGIQMRSTKVLLDAAHGGEGCPTKQTRTCNTQHCPVDCRVSAWSSYAPCSAVCGGGLSERSRTVLSRNSNGGKLCPLLTEFKDCNTQGCPIHCAWNWLGWNACSKSCGTGKQIRYMAIMTMNENNGTACPTSREEERTCSTDPCFAAPEPTKLVKTTMTVAGFTESTFTVEVQDGFKAAMASVLKVPVERIEITSVRAVNAAPVGQRRLLQSATATAAAAAAAAATATLDVQYTVLVADATAAIATTSVLSSATPTTLKEFTSSFKMMLSTEGITAPAGLSLKPLLVTQADGTKSAAVTEAAPTKCKLADWGAWSACSEKCGGGIRKRQRSIITGRASGMCLGQELWQLGNCNEQGCPSHCQYEWDPWGPCSKTCGSGVQSRNMKVLQEAKNGGSKCPDAPKFLSTRTCATETCPAFHEVNCTEVAGFVKTENRNAASTMQRLAPAVPDGVGNTVQECEQACGANTQCTGFLRTRLPGKKTVCVYYAETFELGDHARFFAYHDMYRKLCSTRAPTPAPTKLADFKHPVDCRLSHWTPFTRCSHPCAGGVIVRTRQVLVPAAHGGRGCPSKLEVKNCNQQPCPVHCQFDWKDWTPCTKTCGFGTQKRQMHIVRQPLYGGEACPPETTSSRVCGTAMCPNPYSQAPTPMPAEPHTGPEFVDCTLSDWGAWSKCTDECGGGVKSRSRHSRYMFTYGGKACASTTEKKDCNNQSCPTHCTFKWEEWSACDKECGTGMATSKMVITQQALNGGHDCESFRHRTRACNTQSCAPTKAPVPSVAPTASPSSADFSVAFPHSHAPTDSPTQDPTTSTPTAAPTPKPTLKFVSVTESPSKSPTMTPPSAPPTPTPIDCAVTPWLSWGPCSEACGGGVQERKRIVMRAANAGGTKCPNLVEEQNCNADKACPVHCKHEWKAWTACSVSCGPGGVQQRAITVVVAALHGGVACPRSQERTCSTAACPTPAPTPLPESAYKSDAATNSPVTAPTRNPTTKPTPLPRQDCLVTPWGKFSACSAPCGGGVQNRTRLVSAPAQSGGAPCPRLLELRNCNTEQCDLFPQLSACSATKWEAWGACSVSCGDGVRARVAATQLRGAEVAAHCPKKEQKVCNVMACPTPAPVPTVAPTFYVKLTLSPTAAPTSPPTVDTCACASTNPCQHNGGSTCFKTVDKFDYYDWQTKSTCPPDSRMCDCQCSRFTPCKKTGPNGMSLCVAQQLMYGQSVCPAHTLHCKWDSGSANGDGAAGGGVPTTAPTVPSVGFRVKAVTRTVMSLENLSKKQFEKKVMLFLKDFAEAAGVQEKEVMCKYQSDIQTAAGRRLAESAGIIVSCAVAASDYKMAEDLKKNALANEFDMMFGDKIKNDLGVKGVTTKGVEVVPINSPRPTPVPTLSPTQRPTTEDGETIIAPSIVVKRAGVGCVAGHCK